uniref:Uncharacterized protein n=1 Tax=Rhizophora mucronata TaxID=61149 RepID=A0A2P2NFU0_RHIMU
MACMSTVLSFRPSPKTLIPAMGWLFMFSLLAYRVGWIF